MDQWILILVLVISLGALVVVARHFWPRLKDAISRSSEPAASAEQAGEGEQNTYIDMQTHQQQDGITVAEVSEQPEDEHRTIFDQWRARLNNLGRKQQPEPGNKRSPLRRATTVVLLVLLIVVAAYGISMLPGAERSNLQALYHRLFSTNRFVILVAPFEDGSDGQTGRNVAEELVRELEEQGGNRLVVIALDAAPTSEEAALALTEQYHADVLLWGAVQPGGMLDDTTLSPRIIYTPSGIYAPNAWVGYAGRFAMPHSYALVEEQSPINGSVVLPPLMLALEAYSHGAADMADDHLEDLLNDTLNPLNPSLLLALRGNIHWARGTYDQATTFYTSAIASSANQYDQGVLRNNLGAILLDQRNLGAASDALTRSFQLMGDDSLAALHYNLGVLALHEGRQQDAVSEFEQVATMLPKNTPVRLLLTDLYREAGALEQAAAMLKESRQQARGNGAPVPQPMRKLASTYLTTRIAEQEGLLRLAQAVNARGPLAWELEVTPVESQDAVNSAADTLREAVETTDSLIAQWHGRATADAASLMVEQQQDELEMSLVGTGQASLLQQTLDRQRYHLALALIEQERTSFNPPESTIGSLWSAISNSFGSASSEAEQLLRQLLRENPDNVPVLVAYARASWLRFNPTETAARYEDVRTRAPQAPEGYYGAGMLAMQQNDTGAARQWMQQALERNTTFFPARIKLAELAQPATADGNWAETLTHLRILYEHYPSEKSGVQLAAALRQSGAANYAEAEQVLQQLDQNNNRVLLEEARLARAQGETDTAIATYRQAAEGENPPVDAWTELGDLLVAQGKTQEAIREFQSAVAWDDDNIAARLALADLYLEDPETYDEADEHYRYIIEYEEDNPGTVGVEELLKMGNVLLDHNQPELAKDALHMGVAQQPANATLHHRLGETYLLLNNAEGTRLHEQRALELAGDDQLLRAKALTGLGDLAQWEEQFDQAIAFYNEALTLVPDLLPAHLGLGKVALHRGNWAMAQSYFEQAITSDTGQHSPLAHFWYAEALLHQNKLYEAGESYRHAMELQGESRERPYPEALLGLAQVQKAMGEPGNAEQTVNQALNMRPDYAEALLFKGKLLQEQDKTNQALQAYDASIRANDQLFETRYLRGLIFLERQQYDNAARDLQAATRLLPDNSEAYYWLGRANLSRNRPGPALTAFNRVIELQGEFLEDAQRYQRLIEEEIQNQTAAGN